MWRRSTLFPLIAATWACFCAGPPASAQESDEPEEDAPAAPPVPRRVVRIPDRQFERWLFGIDGNAETARRIAEARLRSRIGFIDQLCGISREQSKKLELAGRGDLKHFFDHVQEMRERCRAAEDDIVRLRRIVEEAQDQGKVFRQQLFNDESMFAKTLRTTLDAEQSVRYLKRWNEPRLLRHQSRVEWVSRTLQKNLALSEGERLRLLAVLLEETRPPRDSGPADYYGILFQASRIPENKLRSILDETEWRLLLLEFEEARRRQPMLRESGLLPEDPPAWESAHSEPSRDRGERAEPGTMVRSPSAREKRAS